MARDPPSLLANSELRDISLRPSTISNARITIIHPQLRDLILPVERGRVLYPRGNGIEEVRWKSEYHEERKEEQGEDVPQKVVSGSPKPFVRLNFVPNCLTGSRGMVAAGGQAGELHISHIPPWFEKLPIGQEIPQRHFWNGPDRPPSLNVMLDTRSINNSIVLLPEWPDRWAEQSRKRSTGYIGRRRDNDVRERREVMEDTRERELSEGLDASVDNDDDEAMDLDDDVPDYIQPLSPATYPNTVPFLHAPRIPMAAISSGSSATSRRASSFSHDRVAPDQPATTSRVGRQSFSIPSRSTQPPIRVVSSTPGQSRSASVSSSRHSPSPAPRSVPLVDSDRKRQQASEPRFLISSNDQTIKMFTLRDMPPDLQRSQLSYERSFEASRLDPTRPLSRSTRNIPGSSSNISTDWRDHQFDLDAAMARSGYSPSSLFSRDRGSVSMSAGSAAGSVLPAQGPFRPIHPSIGLDSGLPASQRPPHTQRAALRSPGQAPESGVRATASGKRDERRLKQIGGSHFGSPVNHSSFSPDLRTMVSVGDSTDVHIHEVIDGGRKFRKIATYNAATDSGFSSAWSKDGRKFAVASQDGQVTVWDHRSSRPLAILFTSSTPAPRVRRNPLPEPRLPLWEDVYPGYNHFDSEEEGSSSTGSREGGRVVLVDPITGEPSTGASTSGREAARVVKFSPEGSSRDLMVFSEEGTNIHLVDAKTFTTRVVLPVPLFADAPGNTPPRFTHRTGVEGGECGIAGVAFDPTGDWLYSGTERSVVEWDLRRLGGGEGGTWDMA